MTLMLMTITPTGERKKLAKSNLIQLNQEEDVIIPLNWPFIRKPYPFSSNVDEFLEEEKKTGDYTCRDVSNDYIDILYYINPFSGELCVNAVGFNGNSDVWRVDREVLMYEED